MGDSIAGKRVLTRQLVRQSIYVFIYIIAIVAVLFMDFADIFAVAIMGIVSVTNSRCIPRTLYGIATMVIVNFRCSVSIMP